MTRIGIEFVLEAELAAKQSSRRAVLATLARKALLCGLGLLGTMQLAASEPSRTQAAFGTWASAISAEHLARSATELSDLRVVGEKMYWLESRPEQAGRYVVVTPDERGGIDELTPIGFSSRTRVHEYGGAPYVVNGKTVYFSNLLDQRLYRLQPGATPVALTAEGYRYADCVAGASDRLFCIREDHTKAGEAKNTIVAVSTSGKADTVLFSGSDFVAYPRVSQDGRYLAWIAWDHPSMPWDATTLYVAKVGASGLSDVVAIAGRHADESSSRRSEESVLEPAWAADGTLYYISDRTGWWNLYRWKSGRSEAALELKADLAHPLWTLGRTSYALANDDRAVIRYCEGAIDKLGVLDLKSGRWRPLDLPFVSFSGVQILSSSTAVAIAGSRDQEPAVVTLDLDTGAYRAIRSAAETRLDPTWISHGQAIEFPTAGGQKAYGFYYPPTNPEFTAPPSEKPPLLVTAHGGPTSHNGPSLNLAIQYWTSRGFAVVDVNYRGSSGHGRSYRRQLIGQWGLVDVQDVEAAARFLIETGRADPRRIAIRGRSAGGFTTLAALAFSDLFKAGANYFGVSDLEALTRETHKFESRYLDGLVAPYPEGKAVLAARSPIHHLDGFNEPLITFQGSEDVIVPPNQSQMITHALRKKGVPVAYLEFDGEQHVFRKADTIIRAHEAELYFYGRVFGFTPAGSIEPVEIHNLPGQAIH